MKFGPTQSKKSLSDYLENKFKQLRPGGHLIIRDVVGPEDKDREIWLHAKHDDGSNDEIFKEFDSSIELGAHLANFLPMLVSNVLLVIFSKR